MESEFGVVVFADLVGFTALTEAHGDWDAVGVADRLVELAQAAVTDGVEIVKTIGDAVMLRGESVEGTVGAVLRLVDAVEHEPRFPAVRVGVHAGPVIARPGDVFGSTVNVASRLSGVARSGEVVASRPVVSAVGDSLVAHPLGALTLRNVPEPVEAFALRRPEDLSAPPVFDPVCRMRLDPEEPLISREFGGRPFVFCSNDCAGRFDADPFRYVEVTSD